MQYFYKKALLLKKEDEVIDEKVFRYDGPKPEFKEAAIILLADAIEAAVDKTLLDGVRTADIARGEAHVSTTEMTKEIIDRI